MAGARSSSVWRPESGKPGVGVKIHPTPSFSPPLLVRSQHWLILSRNDASGHFAFEFQEFALGCGDRVANFVSDRCPGQHDDDRGAMQRQPEHRSQDIEGHPGSINSTRTASTVHLPNLSRLAITLGGETTDHQTLAWRFTNGPVWLKLGGCIRQPTEFPSQVRAIRIRCRFINTIALVNGCEPNDKGHPRFINRRSQIQQRVGSLTRKTRIRAGVRESQSI